MLLGGLATAIGVFTYSQRVIRTVGSGLMRLSPEAALVVVLAQSLVLFLFASQGLESASEHRSACRRFPWCRSPAARP